MKPLSRLIAGIALGVSALTAMPSWADSFPSKPIKVIVPFAAGGQGDVMARLIIKTIEEKQLLSQPIAVINVPGGGGTIGVRQAHKADADGHTLLYLHQTLMTTELQGKLKFDYRAFTPVAETNNTCLVTATGSESGIDSADSWIAQAKADPKKIKDATLLGSAAHFTTAMISKAADMQVGLVNVGGGSDRIASLLGNHTQTAVLVAAPIAANPGLKGLIYYGEERNPQLPQTPTAKELGYDVISCLNNVWWAPGNTPTEAVSVLQNAFAAALEDPELIAAIEQKGDTAKLVVGDALDARLADIYARLKAAAADL
ncbi:Bug family tripartite tricarboxylate transporter substrate binding protein [Marinobacterium rhizophilum]|uniref:Tripartite tricarboxylate transporter substrate binding protein n=1 Tax=Marinobacterium rhizophilum TaxID=420402 RepID=A0ABY5HJN5_9GAMM|nr:tripartite tricarboxylate transporter substrate binding protein [Marinobacterium rhizophilum]UTW12601.1 tripartite tricarboxylate transporter substrate binding protein [Marinobacterium rhizophilum]